ncbi:MAG: hypothetical protein NC412_09955 [Roseburia sp.]|nr:hypothetical protein [Roseburia sp.]MCM1278977.1 hypothetical protein [Robinsoniella sp.]
MELLKEILWMLLTSLLAPTIMIFSCRVNSMTFKSFSRVFTIKNRRLAKILIAEESTWGVSTSRDKRNKMSILGIVSWILFLPQTYFYLYDWWVFITTGVIGYCEKEKIYLYIVNWFYLITVTVKAGESGKYQKGEIW